MHRTLLTALWVAGALASATPAAAYWQAAGAGAGSGAAAVMPAGPRPSAGVAGQSVTLSWPQPAFLDAELGSYAGGGFTLTRYPLGATSGATPAGTCAGRVAAATATLECTDDGVPYGSWEYTVTPVLNTFTGDEGPRSATVAVVPAAPGATAAAALNPADGEQTGGIELRWDAVPGVSGYNVYRRTGSASYDLTVPLNGATPHAATTYTDPGPGLTGGETYAYVVRAVGGTPPLESADAVERSATAIARPAAPSDVSAASAEGGRIDVAWTGVANATGYDVFRRSPTGAYDLGAPLTGTTAVAGTTFADTTATAGSSYVYAVRAVVTGAGGVPVQSDISADSSIATADATAPPAPSAVTVMSAGTVTTTNLCGVVSGTRYVNAAGQGSVSVTATIAAPEPGESVVVTVTSAGSSPVTATVAATGTSMAVALDVGTLVDGPLAVTVRTRDSAGNLSAETGPAEPVVKDVVAPPLTAVFTSLLLGATIDGASECGAGIRATQTDGPSPGSLYPAAGPFVVESGTAYGFAVEAPLLLGSVRYSVTATDMAGNVSPAVTVTG